MTFLRKLLLLILISLHTWLRWIHLHYHVLITLHIHVILYFWHWHLVVFEHILLRQVRNHHIFHLVLLLLLLHYLLGHCLLGAIDLLTARVIAHVHLLLLRVNWSSIGTFNSLLLLPLNILINFVSEREKNSLDSFWYHLNGILDIFYWQLQIDLFKHLLVKSIPIVALLLNRVGIGVVV